MTARDKDTVFAIKLQVPAGINAAHTLRAALKRLLRDHGLRCINIGEDDLKLGQATSLRRYMIQQRIRWLADFRLEAFTSQDGLFYGDEVTGRMRRQAIEAFEDGDFDRALALCEETEAAVLERGAAFREGLVGMPMVTWSNH
jgi:hypothetical protein